MGNGVASPARPDTPADVLRAARARRRAADEAEADLLRLAVGPPPGYQFLRDDTGTTDVSVDRRPPPDT